MSGFESDKKGSIKKSVNFNPVQKHRLDRVAERLKLVRDDGKAILSPTVNTSIFLTENYLVLRDEEIENVKDKIKKWNMRIPDVFDVCERNTLHSTLTKEGKIKFVRLSTLKRGEK